MPITLQMMINNDLLGALASAFNREYDSQILMTSVGFPAGQRPNFDRFDNTEAYWFAICERIANGVNPGNFEALLSAAANRLPANKTFKPFRVVTSAVAPANPAVNIYPPNFPGKFDVFISYASVDRDTVRTVREELIQRGVSVWMDEWNLPLGVRFRPELEKIITEAKWVIACIGPSGEGPWQAVELDAALGRSLHNDCRLIPLTLPGVGLSAVPLLARQFNGRSLQGNASDTAIYDRLAREVKTP